MLSWPAVRRLPVSTSCLLLVVTWSIVSPQDVASVECQLVCHSVETDADTPLLCRLFTNRDLPSAQCHNNLSIYCGKCEPGCVPQPLADCLKPSITTAAVSAAPADGYIEKDGNNSNGCFVPSHQLLSNCTDVANESCAKLLNCSVEICHPSISVNNDIETFSTQQLDNRAMIELGLNTIYDISIISLPHHLSTNSSISPVALHGGSSFGIIYRWDFGDGSPIAVVLGNPASPVHVYSSAGDFVVRVEALNQANNISANALITVVDSISGLTLESTEPTILGKLTVAEAAVTGGTDVQYIFATDDDSHIFLQSGGVIAIRYPHAGKYVLSVTARNAVSNATGSATVRVVRSTSPQVLTVTNTTCGLPLHSPVQFIAIVLYNNISTLPFAWHIPGLLDVSGNGLSAVELEFETAAVHTLTVRVSDVVLQYRICANESSGPLGRRDRVSAGLHILVGSVRSAYVVAERETWFVALFRRGRCLDCMVRWSFNDSRPPVTPIGRAVRHTFDNPGTFSIVAAAYTSDNLDVPANVASVSVTVERQLNENVKVMATTALPVVNETVYFGVVTDTSIEGARTDGGEPNHLWLFDDEPPSVITGHLPEVEYRFQTHGYHTVSVIVYNNVSVASGNLSTMVVDRISGLMFDCSETFSTGVYIRLDAHVLTGFPVDYNWTLVDAVTGQVLATVGGPTFVFINELAGTYRAVLTAWNMLNSQTVFSEFRLQEPVSAVSQLYVSCYCPNDMARDSRVFTGVPTTIGVLLKTGTDALYNWTIIGPSHDLLSVEDNTAIVVFNRDATYRVIVTISNNVSSEIIAEELESFSVECDPPDVQLIGSSERVELCSRKIRIEAVVDTACSAYSLIHQWTIYNGTCNRLDIGSDTPIALPDTILADTPSLFLPARTLVYGQYCVCFVSQYSRAPGSNNVTVDLTVTASPLQALIVGGDGRSVVVSDEIIFDGSSSYDPDVDEDAPSVLSYLWTCEYSENVCSEDTECLLSSCNAWWTQQNSSIIVVPENRFVANRTYVITLSVSALGRPSSLAVQKVFVSLTSVLVASITCVSCRDMNQFTASSSRVVKLVGDCTGCDRTTTTYNWSVERDIGDSTQFLPINMTTTTTGGDRRNLVVRSSVLSGGYSYRFQLNVTSGSTSGTGDGGVGIRGSSTQIEPLRGFAVLELTPAPPAPTGGICTIGMSTVTEYIVALENEVYVDCFNWIDNSDTDSPLEYHVYVIDTVERSGRLDWYPVYRGSRSTATFYLSPLFGCNATISLNVQIIDSLGSKTLALEQLMKVSSLPEPRLPRLTEIVYEELPRVLLTSDPRLILQYIITILLQLNSEARFVCNPGLEESGTDREQRENRTEMRAELLTTLYDTIQLNTLQDIQQMAFALHLITFYVDEFPCNQSYYEMVSDLLENMIDLLQPYISQGYEGEEFVPAYLLDTAGNLVDIVSSDLSNTTDLSAEGNVSVATQHRLTIEKTVEQIDKIMIIIFQTKVSDEEPVTFDTGYLHSWGNRIDSHNIRENYTNPAGSCVIFPKELLLVDYGDETEVFQFVSTLAVNPYTWGSVDGQTITTEVVRVAFAFINGTYLQVANLNSEDSLKIGLVRSHEADPSSSPDSSSPSGRMMSQTTTTSTCGSDFAPGAGCVRLSPMESQFALINLSTVAEADISLELLAFTEDGDSVSNNVTLSAYMSQSFIPHPWKYIYYQEYGLTWNDSTHRHELYVYYFAPHLSETAHSSFYVTLTNNNSRAALVVELSIQSILCKQYDESTGFWDTSGCYAINSTATMTVCKCDHVSQYGASDLPYSTNVTFQSIPTTTYSGNVVVITTVCVLTLFLVLGTVLGHYWDVLEHNRYSVVPLCGIDAVFRYEITIITGRLPGSGTTANVSIELTGENDVTSGARHLARPGAFRRASQDSFVVATPKSLGAVESVRVWHDNSGSSPSWNVYRVSVRDLQTAATFHFVADCRLTLTSLDRDAGVEVQLKRVTSEQLSIFRTKFSTEWRHRFPDEHLFWSIFDCPAMSHVTRSVRFMCLAVLLNSALGLNTLWYAVVAPPTDYELLNSTSVFLATDAAVAAVVAVIVVVMSTAQLAVFRSAKRPRQSGAADHKGSETVEMDACISVTSTSFSTVSDQTSPPAAATHGRPAAHCCSPPDVSAFVDLNVDIDSLDSLSLPNNKPRQLHRTGAVWACPEADTAWIQPPALSSATCVPDDNETSVERPSLTSLSLANNETNIYNSEHWSRDNIITRWLYESTMWSRSTIDMQTHENKVVDWLDDCVSDLPDESRTTLPQQQQQQHVVVEHETIMPAVSTKANVDHHLRPEIVEGGDSNNCFVNVDCPNSVINIPWHPVQAPYFSSDSQNDCQTVDANADNCRKLWSFTMRRCLLPNWFVILTTVVYVLVTCGFVFVTLYFGHRFCVDLSVRWFVVCLGSCVFVAVLDILKVTLWSLIRSLTTATVDLDSFTNNFHVSLDLSNDDDNHPRTRRLAGFALLRAREEGRKLALLNSMMRHSVVYLSFLLLVLLVNYSTYVARDGFMLRRDVIRKLESTTYGNNQSFATMGSIDDYWQWLSAVAVPAVSMFGDGSYPSILVGAARLRQIRSLPVSCAANDVVDSQQVNYVCNADGGYWVEDKDDYAEQWRHLPDNTTLTSTPWTYLDNYTLYSADYLGEVGWYDGAGFTASIDEEMLRRLKDENWIDQRTRFVVLEFTVYNAAANLYVSVAVAVEFPISGGVYVSDNIVAMELMTVSGLASALIALETLIAVVCIYLLVDIVRAIRQQRFSFLADVWNYNDLSVFVLSCSSVALFIAVMCYDDSAHDVYLADNTAFVSFSYAALLHDFWRYVNALLLLLLMLITCRQLRFIRCLAVFNHTLRVSLGVIGWIGFVAFFTVLVYSQLAYLWYGSVIREFRSVASSFVSLTAIIRGTTPFLSTLYSTSNLPLVATFVIAFVVSVFLLSFGTAIGALLHAYSFVRKKIRYYSPTDVREYEMIDVLMKQFKKWIGVTKQKPMFRQVKFQGVESAVPSRRSSPAVKQTDNNNNNNNNNNSVTCHSDDKLIGVDNKGFDSVDVDSVIKDSDNSRGTLTDADSEIDGSECSSTAGSASDDNSALWDRLMYTINKIEDLDHQLTFQHRVMTQILYDSNSQTLNFY